jgi:hypothetical protein
MWRTYSAWMEGAVESDIALIEESMERSATPDAVAPTARETSSIDAEVATSRSVSRVNKFRRLLGVGRICQSICQYAQALMS